MQLQENKVKEIKEVKEVEDSELSANLCARGLAGGAIVSSAQKKRGSSRSSAFVSHFNVALLHGVVNVFLYLLPFLYLLCFYLPNFAICTNSSALGCAG
jgi:hypothetical protein